jgi:hypothetical protein
VPAVLLRDQPYGGVDVTELSGRPAAREAQVTR